jgi:hypothetical protein
MNCVIYRDRTVLLCIYKQCTPPQTRQFCTVVEGSKGYAQNYSEELLDIICQKDS